MRIVDLIEKKKKGSSYTRDEIQFIIDGITNGTIADYQISAWLMAVWFAGMNDDESAYLTEMMAKTGEMLIFST